METHPDSSTIGDLVIGSGPSGVAVASALLERGRRVTMIDGGQRLEPARVSARESLADKTPETWSRDDRSRWQAPQFEAAVGQVRRYGSDFAMEPAEKTFASQTAPFRLRASHAAGGLSNLWGSALLPYAAADMAGWPITANDLAPHYRAIAKFLPIAGRNDDLHGLFPTLPIEGNFPLTPSPQAARLLDRMSRARAGLGALGLTAGQSRQAVAQGCKMCGQCLHGCPWGLIWQAGQQVETLRRDPNFTYRPGLIVRHFSEGPDHVTLTLADGQILRASRAYFATGVLESARILLASGATQLTLRDSHHGFLPALHLWPSPRRPDRGPFHTLPQAFVELTAPDISPYLVHAQLYTWNEFFERDLVGTYGRRLPGSDPIWRAMARRLIVSQIFLHSDHSACVHLTLAADGRLNARVDPNPETGPIFDAAARRLAKGLRLAGLAPLTFARRQNPVGSSFHAGATLPMSDHPSVAQSDILGRPKGLQRVHIVDASVLPAIPATTITLPVMANAHRIGAQAP